MWEFNNVILYNKEKCCHTVFSTYFKGILSIDLFTFSKYVTKAILLFNDKIALMQIYLNVFTTCIHITICELVTYFFN